MGTKSLLVLPGPLDKLPVAPYANCSYTLTLSAHEITILFMRAPLIDDKMSEALEKSPGDVKETVGQVVASVCIPRDVALQLGVNLVAVLGQGQPMPQPIKK